MELKATKILQLGETNASEYPLAKKRQSFEFLREKMHLRPRTNTIGAVARIRNALAYATHEFFQSNGFVYVHTPLITAADCEGAGEMFQVTTLLPPPPTKEQLAQAAADAERKAVEAAVAAEPVPVGSPEEIAAAEAAVGAQGEVVRALKGRVKDEPAAKTELGSAVAQLQALKAELARLKGEPVAEGDDKKKGKKKGKKTKADDEAAVVAAPSVVQEVSIDYAQDFFGRPAYLTVSGQLNGEYYASALSNVYTFGPTFRAENSHTSRHLAEFWMIEPEIAYCELSDLMRCAEDYVKHCCRRLLERCAPDLAFIADKIDKDAVSRLEHVAKAPFARCSYTQAIEILERAIAAKEAQFEFPVEWGIDLASEHERYLTEKVFKLPVIVYDYPKEIKAFYMRANEDGKTVAAMDVLVPGVGELIGGSQREERYDVLCEKILETGMELDAYQGYLDLRKFGTVPHAGFGLGFERLVLFATGLDNIREAIPFPRWPGHAEF